MKALTLWQPWATLVAIGAKKIETRSWKTSYRGPLAIHAAKRPPVEMSRPFVEALKDAGYVNEMGVYVPSSLPMGAVIAICELTAVIKIDWHFVVPADPEYTFGNYDVGRYAWYLDDVVALPYPVSARGRQRLWEWEV